MKAIKTMQAMKAAASATKPVKGMATKAAASATKPVKGMATKAAASATKPVKGHDCDDPLAGDRPDGAGSYRWSRPGGAE